jgi:hypothetical protein
MTLTAADAVRPGGRVSEPGLAASVLLAVAALLITVISLCATAIYGVKQPLIALAFGLFIGVGAFLRLRLPGEREVWPVATAGALAYSVLPWFGGISANHAAYQAVSVTALAMIAGMLPHMVASRLPALDLVARQVLAVAFAAFVFRPSWQFGEARGYPAWELSLIMLGVCVLALLLDAAMASLVRSARTRAPFIRTLGDELTAGLGLNSAVAATAVMISMTSSAMSFWALPVFALQMVLVQVAFKRYAMIRATYRQTIRALSRVTEVGGYTETGHARRVCDISLAVGREMGMAENDLLNLEYAALMHDIGQLSLDDPIPGGATVVAAPYQQRQIADKGADVIVETGVLDEVARIVRHIPDPYRRPQEVADKSIPLASRIIRAVNAFDDLVGGSLEGSRRFEALERLRLGMVYDFDPKVVETLSRIVERNTSFAM